MRCVTLSLALLTSIPTAYASTFPATGSHAATSPRLVWSAPTHEVVDRSAARTGAPARPKDRVRSPVGQSAGALRIPDTAFSPARINPSFDRVESNAQADKDAFRSSHSVPYESLYRISGYYERADWTPAGASETALFRYQASTFATTGQAVSAWQDGVTHSQSVTGRTSTDCTSAVGVSCANIQFPGTAGGASVEYSEYFLQHNQCLAETEVQYTAALLSSYGSQLRQTFGNMNAAAVNALRSVCLAPTAFNIVSVRFETKNAKPDWNLKNSPLRQVRAGTTIHVSVYWYLTSAPAGSRPHYVATVSRNGTVVRRIQYSGTGAYHPSYTYWQWFRYRVKKPGTYSLAMTVSLNGQSKTGQAPPLTAVSIAPKPPQLGRATFQLVAIQTLNSRGQSQTDFKPGQTVEIKARFVIANLSGTIPVEVDRVTQFTVNGQWQSVAFNAQQFRAAAGANFATSSFQLSSTVQPGRLRFIVSLRIAGRTQQRSVVIRVS